MRRIAFLACFTWMALGLMARAASAAPMSFLTTDPDRTFLDFGFGPVPFMGVPLGPGSTDTKVERMRNPMEPFLPETIPIELVELSLTSVNPIIVAPLSPTSFFDVFVTLDHTAPPSAGQMMVMGDNTGGTFDSFFDIFVTIDFVEVGNPLNSMRIPGQGSGQSQGDMWQSTPPPGAISDPGFYLGLPVSYQIDFQTPFGPASGIHTVRETRIPEPGTCALFAAGTLGVIVGRRRKKTKTAA